MKPRSVYRSIVLASVAAFALASAGCDAGGGGGGGDDQAYRLKTGRIFDETGSLLYVYHYAYDSEGKYSGNYMTDENDVTLKTYTYTYGSPYGYTERFSYTADGHLNNREVRTFDTAGRVAQTKSYAANDNLDSTETSIYDAAGKLVRVDIAMTSGDVAYYLYEYNAAGERTKRTDSYNGAPNGSRVYTYENGRWTRIDYYDETNELDGYSEFDWEDGDAVETILSAS